MKKSILTIIGILLCVVGYSADYVTYASQALSNWNTATWQNGITPGLNFPAPTTTHNAIINPGHTKTHDATGSNQIGTSGTVTVYGCLNLNRSGTSSMGNMIIKNGGLVTISTTGTYTITGTLTIETGGTLNINGGTVKISGGGNSLLCNGTINLNGGTLERSAGTTYIYSSGIVNVNSSGARFSWSGSGTPLTYLYGIFDCKSFLSSSNYTYFRLGNVFAYSKDSIKPGKCRIRTSNAYLPYTNSAITSNNNFFGFNDSYGGTVEYYGTSTIYLDSYNSRSDYYDLEVSTTGGLSLGTLSNCCVVNGVLHLKSGNLKTNNKKLLLRGTVAYNGTNYIEGSSSGIIWITGKITFTSSQCSSGDAGITTNIPTTGGSSVYSQGSIIDIHNLDLRLSAAAGGPASLGELKIFREDIVTLKSNLTVNTLLDLSRGILKPDNSSNCSVTLNNSDSSALVHRTTGYTTLTGWISGKFKRKVAANTGELYDFPVGVQNVTDWNTDNTKYRRLSLEIGTMSSINYITASFNTAINNCSGALTVVENGVAYQSLSPDGFWDVTPDAGTYTVDYVAMAFIYGFSGLIDNQYGIYKRPSGSLNCQAWDHCGGTLNSAGSSGRIHELNGSLEIGYAKRSGLNNFSEIAIGLTNAVIPSLAPPTNVMAVASPSALCAFDTLTLTGNATDATSWSWSGPNGFASTEQNPVIINAATSASGVYTLTATNSNGSSSATTTQVTVFAGVPSISGITATPQPVCPGSTVLLQSNATGCATWSWTGPGGFISTAASPQIVNAGTSNAGIYTLTVSNACGSDTLDTFNLSVGLPQIITTPINGADTVCQGTSAFYKEIAANAQQYFWSINPTSAGQINGTDTLVTVAWSASYSGNATISVTASHSCDSAAPVHQVVHVIAKPIAGYTAVVYNDSVVFTNTSSNADSFSWSFGDLAVSNDSNPVHLYTASGTYYVKLLVSNQCGIDSVIHAVSIIITGINETTGSCDFKIQPNPFSIKTRIEMCNAIVSSDIAIDILNIYGGLVGSVPASLCQNSGKRYIEIDDRILHGKKGTFIVNIRIDKAVITRKIVRF